MDLKSLLKKNPLEMTDEELREDVRKLQNVRRIPDLSAAVHGTKLKKSTKKKVSKKEQEELDLEAAMKAFVAKKEKNDKADTENIIPSGQ